MPPPSSPPPLQLNLIHSEVSNLAGFDVEGVINPTTAELELKDDLGEPPTPTPISLNTAGRLKIPQCLNVSSRNRCYILTLNKSHARF